MIRTEESTTVTYTVRDKSGNILDQGVKDYGKALTIAAGWADDHGLATVEKITAYLQKTIEVVATVTP